MDGSSHLGRTKLRFSWEEKHLLQTLGAKQSSRAAGCEVSPETRTLGQGSVRASSWDLTVSLGGEKLRETAGEL